MYNVTLMNLTEDARTVDVLAQIDKRNVGSADLAVLFRNFSGLDPLANAGVDAEIRVRARGESFLLRSEQRKLVLYDVLERDLPGQVLTVEEAMEEIDGTAAAARHNSAAQARAAAIESFAAKPAPVAPKPAVPEPVTAAPVAAGPAAEGTYVSNLRPFDYGNNDNVVPVFVRPVVRARPQVLAALAVLACVLLGAIIYLTPFGGDGAPAGFVPAGSAELAALQAPLTGVYLTGSEPGQHGIVVGGPGELKLFELGAVEAPRVVYAAGRLGRWDAKLCLATDQPGGLIEVGADGSLVYGGEVYHRIP